MSVSAQDVRKIPTSGVIPPVRPLRQRLKGVKRIVFRLVRVSAEIWGKRRRSLEIRHRGVPRCRMKLSSFSSEMKCVHIALRLISPQK